MPSFNRPPTASSVPRAQAWAALVGGSILAAYDYAEKGFGGVTNIVWARVKPEDVPKYPGWKASFLNTAKAMSCKSIHLLLRVPN